MCARCPSSTPDWPVTMLAENDGVPPPAPTPPCPHSACRRAPDHQLPEEEVRAYASEILLALQYLHLQGVIYR